MYGFIHVSHRLDWLDGKSWSRLRVWVLARVLTTVRHNQDWFRISRLFRKSLLSLKSAEPPRPHILPALPVMFYATWGVKLHEKGADGGHSADLSLASPHATGTKRTAGWMEPSLSFTCYLSSPLEEQSHQKNWQRLYSLCVLVAGGSKSAASPQSTLLNSVFTLLTVSLECYFPAGGKYSVKGDFEGRTTMSPLPTSVKRASPSLQECYSIVSDPNHPTLWSSLRKSAIFVCIVDTLVTSLLWSIANVPM